MNLELLNLILNRELHLINIDRALLCVLPEKKTLAKTTIFEHSLAFSEFFSDILGVFFRG